MLEQALSAKRVIFSSVNSLANLCQLLGKENIKNKHLIVVRNRINKNAIDQAYNQIDLAEYASDNALMQQIKKVGQTNGRK
jgi:uroporphyrinogen-III synthase